MVWHIVGYIYTSVDNEYVAYLRAYKIDIIASIKSDAALNPGDTLYPIRDALYLLNNCENKMVKVLSASKYCKSKWDILINEHHYNEK